MLRFCSRAAYVIGQRRTRYGYAGRWRLEGRLVRHEINRWPLQALGIGVSQLGHSRWISRSVRRRRLRGRGRSLSSLCFAGLPLGAPDTDLPQAQGPRRRDFAFPSSTRTWAKNGWEFRDRDGGTKDHLGDADYLWQVYVAAKPDYSGRVTVPVLWDKKTGTVVSNESAEIIRMFNSAFNAIAKPAPDYYPAALREEIDDINEVVYHKVNNGVYKAGFATTQDAYKEHVAELFDALDMLDERLRHNRYLTGDTLTEADWRLFTTLVRFDPVYVGHFKCNIRRIADYPALSGYLRELYQMPGIAGTVNMDHIKNHYYGSHETINPTGIVPVGPELDLDAPHGRETLPKAA
jgi:putative glutathione S-transferase